MAVVSNHDRQQRYNHHYLNDAVVDLNKKRKNWYLGMIISTIVCCIYYVRPAHMIIFTITLLVYGHPFQWVISYNILLLIVISFFLPPMQAPPSVIQSLFWPLLEYFVFDEIIENTPINIAEAIHDGQSYIFACQPHGIVPMCHICSHVVQSRYTTNSMTPTATASMVYWTPILKHLLGIFGLIPATKKSLKQQFKNKKSVYLYLGRTLDIFECQNPHVEVIYLKQRKGFIELAMTQGVDIVPVFFFGNTSILSVWENIYVAMISNLCKLPLSYIWGYNKYVPMIPRPHKLLCVRGQPLKIPKCNGRPKPYQVRYWHQQYMNEVQRLFDEYKHRVPQYKHKTLVIK